MNATATLLDLNREIDRARRWLDDLVDAEPAAVAVVDGLIRQLEASAVRESLARALVAERGLQLADDGARWRMVQGDALELLRQIPDESIDGVFGDPPYSSGGQFRGDRNAQSSDKYQTAFSGNAGKFPEIAGDNRDQRSYLAWCSLWLAECRRAMRVGAPFAFYTDWRQLGTLQDAVQAGGLIMRGVAPWIKPTVRPNAGRFKQSAEFVVWGTNGPTELDYSRWCGPGYWIVPVRTEREHMTEKPVEIARDFARLTVDGGLILDPFAGAATAGVGALLEGRRFLGFELVPECVEVARRWLASTATDADRFAVARGQGSLFGGGSMIGIGSTVQYRGEVGEVRSLVEPRPGWRRALVTFRNGKGEQYVDLDKLTETQEPPVRGRFQKIDRCKGCGAPIVWVRSAVSPALMILDAEPVATGTVTINAAGRAVVAADLLTGDLFAPPPVAPAADVPRYRDHHATCTHPPRRSSR